jgi:hypothetical protein
MASKRPNPERLNRLQIERILNEIKDQQTIPAIRYKLALYRRLKALPRIPPPGERDPDCAYPV